LFGKADSGALWRRHPRCCAGFVRPGRTALFGEPSRGLRGLKRRSRVSVFVGAHDRQDARRDGGIGGVRRAEFGGAVIAIDFPEVADAGFVHRAEVVFAVGIVVVGEGVEGANLLQERATRSSRKQPEQSWR
jgi:hypothetical protein